MKKILSLFLCFTILFSQGAYAGRGSNYRDVSSAHTRSTSHVIRLKKQDFHRLAEKEKRDTNGYVNSQKKVPTRSNVSHSREGENSENAWIPAFAGMTSGSSVKSGVTSFVFQSDEDSGVKTSSSSSLLTRFLEIFPYLLTLWLLSTTPVVQAQNTCALNSTEVATFPSCPPSFTRMPYSEVIRLVTEEVRAVESKDCQDIVARPIIGPKETRFMDFGQSGQTNPLGLAISTGDVKATQEFLNCVQDPSDSNLLVSGYRQLFSPAHLALDPSFPSVEGVPLKVRKQILQAVCQVRFDFNAIPAQGFYMNPPLAGGRPHGVYGHEVDELQGLALLCGADPDVRGSSFIFDLYSFEAPRIFGVAYKELKKGTIPEPKIAPRTKAALRELRKQEIQRLMALPINEDPSQKSLGSKLSLDLF